MPEPLKEKQPETMKDLLATSPDSGSFIAGIVLIAHDQLGYGAEMEVPVSRAVVRAFVSGGILGGDIARLQTFAEGDPTRAYDVLTLPEELQRFKDSPREQGA